MQLKLIGLTTCITSLSSIAYGIYLLTLLDYKCWLFMAIGTAILLLIPLSLKVREALK